MKSLFVILALTISMGALAAVTSAESTEGENQETVAVNTADERCDASVNSGNDGEVGAAARTPDAPVDATQE